MAARISGPAADQVVTGKDFAYLDGLLNGDPGWGRAVTLTEPLTLVGGESISGGLSVAGGLAVTSGGAVITGGVVVQTGGLNVQAGGAVIGAGNLTVSTGSATIAAGLTVSAGGASITGGLTQTSGATSLTGTTFSGTYSSTWAVSATSFTWTGPSTLVGNLTIRNTVPTTLATFDVTAGAQKVTLGTAATPGLYIDVANSRTIIGTTTALGSAANDTFSVIGGTSYFVGNSGPAIGIRYVSTDTVGWTISKDGAGANQDLLFLDDGAAEIIRMGDQGSTYQLKVSGAQLITGALTIANGLLGQSGVFDWQNSGNSRAKFDSTGISFYGGTTRTQPTVTGVLSGAPTLAQLTAVVRSILTAICGSATGVNLVNDLTT